jgi:hypothetical protein
MALSNGYRYGDPAPGEAAIGLGRPPEAAISRCPAVEPPIEPKSAVAKSATIALMSQRPFLLLIVGHYTVRLIEGHAGGADGKRLTSI